MRSSRRSRRSRTKSCAGRRWSSASGSRMRWRPRRSTRRTRMRRTAPMRRRRLRWMRCCRRPLRWCARRAMRAVGMRHFDVQLIGGMVLHSGKISEMKTGEGKTLVATLPCYLNALAGRGVHVVTVNDYLAKRDAEWMGKIYGFLGLTVGVIVHDLSDEQRRAAYGSDITYGTNNEFGFDYLRDNMKFELNDMVQRGHYYCDRGRGGLDPDRRGAYAADHLGPDGPDDGQVRARERDHSGAGTGRVDRDAGDEDVVRRLRGGREGARHHGDRRGLGEDREAAGHRQHRRPGELGSEAPRRGGDQGAQPVQARRGVRGEGRRGHHRRRVHRAG